MAFAVWICDVTTVTALGPDLDTFWQRLLEGRSAIAPIERFQTEGYTSRYAASIKELNGSGTRSAFHYLLTHLINDMAPVPTDASLYTATAKSGIDNMERWRCGEASEPSDVLVSAVAEEVSGRLGLEDSGTNISAACASSAIAVAKGAALIAAGYADSVLIFCLDLVTEFVFSGFSALGALSAAPCMPFDLERTGLSLGEGAGALLLMSAQRAKKEGRPHLGTIAGWGVASDAFHVTAPDPDASGLLLAVGEAMKRARLKTESISAVCAHGTGTVYNDHMELTAFDRLFEDRALPVYSIKGAVGHTLGAAGGIEVAVGLKALENGIAPPTAGFKNGERRTAGKVSSKAAPFTGKHLLSTNSGFGGINAALILERGQDA